MKKAVSIGLVLILLLCCCGCYRQEAEKQGKNEILGVWFSYSELDTMLSGGNFKENFKVAIDNCKSTGITDLFIHIRPFCDSIYPSKLFPLRQSVQGYNFDILEFIIECSHQNDIRVHAWINPYRIKTADTDINTLPENSPARQWLTDDNTENDSNICLLGGVYLNPASSEATRLITDGIREVIENYQIDGIHFDDYFYPTNSTDFDKSSYDSYRGKAESPISQEDWRRVNINAFISNVYNTVKSAERQLIFSISPAASIDKNYQSYYADIKLWVENGYIDWLMPQLYFGFNYPDKGFCFDNLIDEWNSISGIENIKLIIGLASYKIDTDVEIEREEWSSGDLLKREIDYAQNHCDGFCFFSYSSLFGNSENQIKERQNIKRFLNKA